MASITINFSSASAGSGTGPTWSNPPGALAAGGTYALSQYTGGFTKYSQWLYVAVGGSFVPAGATVNGVIVNITRRCDYSYVSDMQIVLTSSIGVSGNKASGSAWPTSAGAVSYGSATDKWGLALTPAIVNNSTFGVGLIAQFVGNDTAAVDAITVDVYYTLFVAITGKTVDKPYGKSSKNIAGVKGATVDTPHGSGGTGKFVGAITGKTVDSPSGTPTVNVPVTSTFVPTYGALFDCNANSGAGIGRTYDVAHGSVAGASITTDSGNTASSGSGTGIVSVIVDGSGGTTSTPKASSYLIPSPNPCILISKVGEMDFTLDITGDANSLMMAWGGSCWQLRKLGNNVIAYGQDGISRLTPHEQYWGETVFPDQIGIYGPDAVCGNEQRHLYIDAQGYLWEMTDEGPKNHDYQEFLSVMSTNLVMSYDERLDVAYICDGTYGYVFSEWGLGQGPPNITGCGLIGGSSFYVAAPSLIVVDPMSCVSDIIDFGDRTSKTLVTLQFGTTTTGTLQAALDYRHDRIMSFVTTPWVNVTRDGMANITVTAQEFKVRWRLLAWEDAKIDRVELLAISATRVKEEAVA